MGLVHGNFIYQKHAFGKAGKEKPWEALRRIVLESLENCWIDGILGDFENTFFEFVESFQNKSFLSSERDAMARPVTLFTGQWADLPISKMAAFTKEAGYDGIELACWGDHFEVDKAMSDDG